MKLKKREQIVNVNEHLYLAKQCWGYVRCLGRRAGKIEYLESLLGEIWIPTHKYCRPRVLGRVELAS